MNTVKQNRITRLSTKLRIASCLLFVASAGCAARQIQVPAESGVDYVAHIEHRGLVVDQFARGTPAVLVPAPTLPFTSGPTFLLQTNGQTVAALWVRDPSHVTVRKTADPSGPILGKVAARWTDGAIQLTLQPTGQPEFHSSVFQRTDGGIVPASLSSQANTVVDVRGMYQAQLIDAAGKPAGWLRVRISPYMAANRIYDGVLPASVEEPLTTAALALVDADVDYIESRAVDVYRGN